MIMHCKGLMWFETNMDKLKEHQWTIEDTKFICKVCGYSPNEEESKFLSSCYWSSFSADIHVTDKSIWNKKGIDRTNPE